MEVKGYNAIMGRLVIGSLMKAARMERGVTQADCSIAIGYSNATFTCDVEKGASSIPAGKVFDFAGVYMPDEKHMLAAAILKYMHGDLWQASYKVFTSLSDDKAIKSIDADVEKWVKGKLEKFNIELKF